MISFIKVIFANLALLPANIDVSAGWTGYFVEVLSLQRVAGQVDLLLLVLVGGVLVVLELGDLYFDFLFVHRFDLDVLSDLLLRDAGGIGKVYVDLALNLNLVVEVGKLNADDQSFAVGYVHGHHCQLDGQLVVRLHLVVPLDVVVDDADGRAKRE